MSESLMAHVWIITDRIITFQTLKSSTACLFYPTFDLFRCAED